MYLRICLGFNQSTKIETHKKYNTFYDKRQKIELLFVAYILSNPYPTKTKLCDLNYSK